MELNRNLDNSDMTNWSSEDWEKYLEGEGLGDIDKEIGFVSSSVSNKIDKILSIKDLFSYIESIELEKNVRIDIDDTEKSITIYDKDNNNVIGEIKPGNYTYYGISNNNHMFQVVNDPYKGKGFGKLLIQAYSKLEEFGYKGFELPKEEYTHTPSMLNLLSSNGYYIVGRYTAGEYEELTDEDIYQIYEDIDSGKYEEDDFGTTYKLKMNK